MKKSQSNSKEPISEIKLLRKASCPALSGKSTLTYDLGQDPSKALHFRVTKNDGGGFFSPEFVPWSQIETAIQKAEPVTSICLRPLFRGKSVNTSGFLLAVLVAEGLLVALPKKTRHFEVTGKSPTGTKASPGKATSKKTPAKKTRN